MTNLIERTFPPARRAAARPLSMQGDERYAAATAIWAKPVGRLPRAIVPCRTPEDVQSAIRAVRSASCP